MKKKSNNFEELISDLNLVKQYFYENINKLETPVKVYTHLDSDGIASGAILGKALFRDNIPFQITVLKQLELEEIDKLSKENDQSNCFFLFSDFGSGQYLDLQNKLNNPFIILDHHLPQGIGNKEEKNLIKDIYEKTHQWHINPYFYGVDGSLEISGAGISYFFTKSLNEGNIDLSIIALIGAIGDIQNQGQNKSFIGLNSLILKDAKNSNLIEIVNDINLSPIKPLNEALAYSSEIHLPGLSGDPNKSLKFLKNLGILIENSNGITKSLMDLNQEEKQKLTSALIEYGSIKSNINPNDMIKKLIINRYLLKNEVIGSDLYEINEFSNLLNACGRTNNASIGIAIAMGDRKNSYTQAQKNLEDYKKMLVNALSWIKDGNIIKEKEYIQYFYGEDMIPENIVGTVCSMLIFDESGTIKKNKPILGYAKRNDSDEYKISARAHKSIVKKGVNLSKVIREALVRSNLKSLGGGHPPAAGTKVPICKIEEFLENCDQTIKKQLNQKN